MQICAAYKPAFIYGGPTMSVSMLSEQLIKAGSDTEVFATTANGKHELPVTPGRPTMVDGVKVTYFRRITKDHSHFSPALLWALWKNAKNFELVHIHAWWNLVSVFSCLIALMRNVPVLLSPRGTLSPYSFHNKHIGPKRLVHTLIGKYLLKKCHLHVTSPHEQQAVVSLFKPVSINILPNFVKLPNERPLAGDMPPPGVLKLLFFSRIEEKKGLDMLIDALPAINVPYHLTIAGDGDKNYIEKLKHIAKKNNVQNHINWAGFFNENKFGLLQAHDLFILPSHDENFGNAVIESLSVGTPVLISGEVGLADYVSEAGLGWICRPNADSISASINVIAKNTYELERIRKEAPGVIMFDFKESNLVKKYIDMYHQLITP